MTRHRIPHPSGGVAVVDVPGTWIPRASESGTVFTRSTPWQEGFADHVTLTWAEGLPASLDEWARRARNVQDAQVPDLHVLHERLDAAGHRRSYLATIDPGVTIIVHERRLLLERLGLVVALTTLPGVDASHADEIEQILGSVTLEHAGTAT